MANTIQMKYSVNGDNPGQNDLATGELGIDIQDRKLWFGDNTVSGGPLATTFQFGAADLEDTAVTAGSYTLSSITVDAQGRITAASSGSGGGGISFSGSTSDGIATFHNSSTATAESNFTFDGTDAKIGGAGKLTLRDGDIWVSSDADGYLDLKADTGVNININGSDMIGVTSTNSTFGTHIVIPNGANIGSVSDTDALSIASTGIVTASAASFKITAGLITAHASNDITLDSANAVVLDAETAADGIQYKVNGTEVLRLFSSSSAPVFKPMVDNKDMIFTQYDDNTVFTIKNSGAADVENDLYVGDDIFMDNDGAVFNMGAGNDFTMTHASTGVTLAANPITITSGGAATWSTSSGDLCIDSAGDLHLDVTDEIKLDSATGDIWLFDAGTKQFMIDLDSTGGEIIFQPAISNDDVVFNAAPANSSGHEVLRLDGPAGGIKIGGSGATVNTINTSFSDNDTSLLTCQGIKEKIEAYSYGSGSGDGTVTSIAMGAGMGGSTITASGTVAVDGVLQDLDTLGAAGSDGLFIVATGAGTFAYESTSTARTSLGLGTGAVLDTATVANGASTLSTGDQIYDHVTSRISGLTSNAGTVTSVATGTGLSGGTITGSGTITNSGVTSNVAGNAITVSGATGAVTINHADTSSQASVDNSGTTAIQDITLDTYGHVTSITSADVGGGGGSSLTVGSDNQVPFVNGAGDDLEYASDFTFNGANFNVGSGNGGTETLTVDGTRSTISIGNSTANIGTAYKIYESGTTTERIGSNTDQLVVTGVAFQVDPFTGYVIDVSATTVTMNHAGGIYHGST